MDKTILAFYVNKDVTREEVDIISKNLLKSLEGLDTIAYFVPTSGDARVECVYPKFVASDELIKSHEKIMEDISNKFNEIIKIK